MSLLAHAPVHYLNLRAASSGRGDRAGTRRVPFPQFSRRGCPRSSRSLRLATRSTCCCFAVQPRSSARTATNTRAPLPHLPPIRQGPQGRSIKKPHTHIFPEENRRKSTTHRKKKPEENPHARRAHGMGTSSEQNCLCKRPSRHLHSQGTKPKYNSVLLSNSSSGATTTRVFEHVKSQDTNHC